MASGACGSMPPHRVVDAYRAQRPYTVTPRHAHQRNLAMRAQKTAQDNSTHEHPSVSPSSDHGRTDAVASTSAGYQPYRWRELRSDGQPSTPLNSQDVPSRMRALFLPEGFPASVSPDYLDYQLWALPTHISGWLSHSLTTSSLLQAVGLSTGPVGTVTLTAAFKWIAKDGVGAAGRLLVGGKLGVELDDDPRRWRMIAEAIATVGLAAEAATSIYPQQFLLLACSASFAKALAKGMGKPAFRVIQTHFSIANNVGAVSAKEEVWEVTGQLAGYASSLALLQLLEQTGTSGSVVFFWAAIQAVHVALRQKSLSCLVFDTLSRKRACMLVTAHVAGEALPDVPTLNRREPIWQPPSSMAPRVQMGCTMEQLLSSWREGASPSVATSLHHRSGTKPITASSQNSSASRLALGSGQQPSESGSPATRAWELESPGGLCASVDSAGTTGADGWSVMPGAAEPYVELYHGEQYMLGWSSQSAWVVLKPGAESRTILRALWQAAWLDANGHAFHQQHRASKQHSTLANGNGSTTNSDACLQLSLLQASMNALRSRFEAFETEAAALGWNLGVVNLRSGLLRVAVDDGA